jgi:RNA polymerase sigma-70 factor (ECF subfamily)
MKKSPPDSKRHFAESWLREYGDLLYSYALSRVGGDTAVAEDLVQETLLAGIQAYGRFRRDSQLGTWLVGILRRKLVDHFRKAQRRREGGSAADFFSAHGHIQNVDGWRGDPRESLENREFWHVFDRCLGRLNAPLAEAFVICVMDRVATKEACRLLNITPTNLSVRLHRARLELRQCLQANWFRRR